MVLAMLRSIAALPPCMIVLVLLPCASAYPSLWVTISEASMRSLRPGGPFGPMQIPVFSNESGSPCQILSDIPESGFESSTRYHVTVSSSVDGGVGHILYPSVGDFEKPCAPGHRPVCTQDAVRVASQTWVWASPEDQKGLDVAEFFAACSSGKHGESWAALPLVVKKKGFEPREDCDVSSRKPVHHICGCGVKNTTCAYGLCCWPNGECKACDKGESGFPPTTWFWFHAILMLLAWVLLFPNGILAACRHRRLQTSTTTPAGPGSATPLTSAATPEALHSSSLSTEPPPPPNTIHRHILLQSVAMICQLVGGACAVLGVVETNSVHFYNSHEILGLCVILLSCLQFVFGILRPKIQDAGRRRVWNRFHRSLGYLLMPLAFATIVIGMLLAKSKKLGFLCWFALSMCFFLVCCSLLLAFLSSDTSQRSGHEGHDRGHSPTPRSSRQQSELTNSGRISTGAATPP